MSRLRQLLVFLAIAIALMLAFVSSDPATAQQDDDDDDEQEVDDDSADDDDDSADDDDDDSKAKKNARKKKRANKKAKRNKSKKSKKSKKGKKGKKKSKKKGELRYSHEAHEDFGVEHGTCETCHVLDDDYIVLAPTKGKDHKPCNDSSCHASEYFEKKPKICVVCHTGVKPWEKQKAELKKRKSSEFGGDLNHKTHSGKRMRAEGINGACKKCHGDLYEGEKAAFGGHGACSPCHGKSAEPAMAECGSCHKMGARKARAKTKTTKWSVGPKFAHDTHGQDAREGKSGETKCVMCHKTIPKAKKLADIKNPTMRSCDACHNGNAAFKTTGFECYRCHGGQGKL